ncbi:MAG: imidazole glycerol phosphate synthase subunit HisH [Planctomycetota bacterium]
MSSATVHIVRTGTANIASVMAGLRRAGARPVLTDDAGVVESSARLVLPGVGAMGATMGAVQSAGLVAALRKRIEQDRPTLAVCMGHQLLGVSSDESPGVPGLGVHDGVGVRFSEASGLRVPQLGWNSVTKPEDGARFLTESGYAYFANSYCFRSVPSDWMGATAVYDGSFVAAIERGNVLTCQFHPELSGAFGARLMRRWLVNAGVEIAQDAAGVMS